MRAEHIARMFLGITHDSKVILAKELANELTSAITAVNTDIMRVSPFDPLSILTPKPELIFEAVRQCPIENARVVLLGQDPYIKPGEAMGMSFSVPRGVNIPPSLKNIYKCLLWNKVINQIPSHGDLTSWARQGVLLLNSALTTRLKTSNAHANAWNKYTDALIKIISNQQRPIIFILFGGFAQEKREIIDTRRHIVLEWGHPSNLNRSNQDDADPKNFKYCTAFTRANDHLSMLGGVPINWDPDGVAVKITPTGFHEMEAPSMPTAEPISRTIISREITLCNTLEAPGGLFEDGFSQNTTQNKVRELCDHDPLPYTSGVLWVFTDGGSKGNGKSHCVSAFGWLATDGEKIANDSGIVPSAELIGLEYKSSNNRGELTAILNALKFVMSAKSAFDFAEIRVVSDSEYSINCITTWIYKWEKDPVKHADKKNLDLIKPAKELVEELKLTYCVKFIHMNSHMDEPKDSDTEEWFMWKCNDLVDTACNKALGRI